MATEDVDLDLDLARALLYRSCLDWCRGGVYAPLELAVCASMEGVVHTGPAS